MTGKHSKTSFPEAKYVLNDVGFVLGKRLELLASFASFSIPRFFILTFCGNASLSFC